MLSAAVHELLRSQGKNLATMPKTILPPTEPMVEYEMTESSQMFQTA